MKEKFIAFLKEKGVYDQFVTNLDMGLTLDEYFHDTEETVKEEDDEDLYKELISGAFTWSNSPEDHDFWSKISRQWKKSL